MHGAGLYDMIGKQTDVGKLEKDAGWLGSVRKGRIFLDWAEISLQTSHAEMELIAQALIDAGAAGVVYEDPEEERRYLAQAEGREAAPPQAEEPVVVKAYLPEDEDLAARLAKLREGIARLARADGFDAAACAPLVRHVSDADWENNWKAYFHTQRVGERIVIQPTWETYEAQPEDIVLRLDPESAFGTGTHPTTAMCLRALETLVRPGMRVFDVGTGSGVLAIAAAKLGAREVVAMDYARPAAAVAAKNVRENGVEDVVQTGVSDLLQGFSGQADLIAANIIADIILRLFDELADHLAPGGRLLASGIIDERLAEVEAAAAAHGLAIEQVMEDAGWAALVIRAGGNV